MRRRDWVWLALLVSVIGGAGVAAARQDFRGVFDEGESPFIDTVRSVRDLGVGDSFSLVGVFEEIAGPRVDVTGVLSTLGPGVEYLGANVALRPAGAESEAGAVLGFRPAERRAALDGRGKRGSTVFLPASDPMLKRGPAALLIGNPGDVLVVTAGFRVRAPRDTGVSGLFVGYVDSDSSTTTSIGDAVLLCRPEKPCPAEADDRFDRLQDTRLLDVPLPASVCGRWIPGELYKRERPAEGADRDKAFPWCGRSASPLERSRQ